MAAVSHGARQLWKRLGVQARAIHAPPRPAPPTVLSDTRAFLARLVSHVFTPSAASAHPAHIRPTRLSSSQSISSHFSLPVRHALSRPFSPPRLPRPPAVPANVTQVGLGTARAFHSGRPIFQNMVDNVPIATRALWEAEWDLKIKKKQARKMRRATQIKSIPKSQEMLKPKPRPIVAESQPDASELDIYFPVLPIPTVTTHLLVPLAPTPTMRLPLSVRIDGGNVHPLLPIADLAAVHTRHRLHSLRVSTLFARLDTANVWEDPGVNVDAYAFGPRHDPQDVQEKQCTILRVTFRGWDTGRVRSILGDSAEGWYSLEETHLDGHPTLTPFSNTSQDPYNNIHTESPLLESVEIDSSCASETEMDVGCDVPSSPPIRATASVQHDLVLPTLDFSSAFSDAVDNLPPPPQPVMFLRTVSELTRDAELASQSSSALVDSEASWDHLSLNSSVVPARWGASLG